MLFLVNLLKKHKRRAVFTVFCSSLTSETLFFPFFAFRLRATNNYFIFSSVLRLNNTISFIDATHKLRTCNRARNRMDCFI